MTEIIAMTGGLIAGLACWQVARQRKRGKMRLALEHDIEQLRAKNDLLALLVRQADQERDVLRLELHRLRESEVRRELPR